MPNRKDGKPRQYSKPAKVRVSARIERDLLDKKPEGMTETAWITKALEAFSKSQVNALGPSNITLEAEQEWYENDSEWWSTDWSWPTGGSVDDDLYELIEITNQDKYGHPTKALFKLRG